MKFYSLALGFALIGLLVLAMSIIYLSHDIKIKNDKNYSSSFLYPNITYISLGVLWLGLALYLVITVKFQLM